MVGIRRTHGSTCANHVCAGTDRQLIECGISASEIRSEDEDDLSATLVLFRIEGRLLGLRHRGRDSLATNLYLPEKKRKAYGCQNS
jgi:hypothetical protein